MRVTFDNPGKATEDNHVETNWFKYYDLLVARPDGSFAVPEDSDEIVVRVRWLSPIVEKSSGDGSATDAATAGISFKDDEFVDVKVLTHVTEDEWWVDAIDRLPQFGFSPLNLLHSPFFRRRRLLERTPLRSPASVYHTFAVFC